MTEHDTDDGTRSFPKEAQNLNKEYRGENR